MSPSRILVVRLGSMGDIVHTLPAAATLKHSFPASWLAWVVEPRWAPLLAGNPYVDEVIEIDRSRLAGLRSAWRNLRRQRFEMVVDFQGLLKSALVASVTRHERIHGYHQSQAREGLAALFYSRRVIVRARHVVDRHLELAEAAGAANKLVRFPLPEGRREGSLPEGGFVLAAPLGGWPGKQWPLEHYGELARLLERAAGIPLVVNGPPASEGVLRRIGGCLIHCSGLDGLIDATRRARFVVGIDSGPLHLAAALGKPGVAIYGPTDPARNGPYGGSLAVLRSPRAVTTYKRRDVIDPSMAEIRPEQVLEALLRQIAVSGAGAGQGA